MIKPRMIEDLLSQEMILSEPDFSKIFVSPYIGEFVKLLLEQVTCHNDHLLFYLSNTVMKHVACLV